MATNSAGKAWRSRIVKTKNISARGGHGMIQHEKKIYLFGGAKKDGDLNEVYEVDLESFSESMLVAKLLPISTFPSLYEFASSVALNKLWVFGGADKEGSRNDVYFCELENMDECVKVKSANEQEDTPAPRTQYGNKALIETLAEDTDAPNNISLVIFGGGCKEDKAVDDTNLYLFNLGTRTWTKVETQGTPPRPRQGHVMLIIGQKLFIYGGLDSREFYNEVYSIDLSPESEKMWTKSGDSDDELTPPPRAAHNAVVIQESFYIFGGFDQKGNALADLWEYNTSTKTWTQINYSGKVTPRMDFAMCTVTKGNKTDILIHGGFNADCIFFDNFVHFSPKEEKTKMQIA